MSTFRQRYEKWRKGDDIEDCTHKQRCEESYQSMVKVLQQNTWIDESRALLGRYLNDLRVPWRHKRLKMMAIAGIIPVAKWLAKIKQRSDVSYRLCKRAREQRGVSTENEWAYQQCLLRWNGNNRHSCPPLHLETFVCQHASCTNTNE